MSDKTNQTRPTCTDCGSKIPEGTPEHMCPQCLLGVGLDPDGVTFSPDLAAPCAGASTPDGLTVGDRQD